MKLIGPYTDPQETLHFTGRVFISSDGRYYNEKTEEVTLEEGDVLRYFTSGQWTDVTWFAVFKPSK